MLFRPAAHRLDCRAVRGDPARGAPAGFIRISPDVRKSARLSQRPWLPVEDDCLRRLYPRYDLLAAQLPHRSLAALKHRARRLGIVCPRHVWTNLEVRRLRQAYAANMADDELSSQFPGCSLAQIKAKARHLGLRRPVKTYRMLGIPLLDAVRARAGDRQMSLVELDRLAGTVAYFQKSRKGPVLQWIAKGAAVLGGRLEIHWPEEEA